MFIELFCVFLFAYSCSSSGVCSGDSGCGASDARAHLQTHGYAVVRGGAKTSEDLPAVAQHVWGGAAFGSYSGGSVVRDSVGDERVVDVSSGAPSYLDVQFHSEMSYSQAPPRFVAFGCFEQAPSGGATFLADMRLVAHHLPAVLYLKLKHLGLEYIRNMGDQGLVDSVGSEAYVPLSYQTWQHVYPNHTAEEAVAALRSQGKSARTLRIDMAATEDEAARQGSGIHVSWKMPVFSPASAASADAPPHDEKSFRYPYLFMSLLDFWGFPYELGYSFANFSVEAVLNGSMPVPSAIPKPPGIASTAPPLSQRRMSPCFGRTDVMFADGPSDPPSTTNCPLHVRWGDGSEITWEEAFAVWLAYARSATKIQLRPGDFVVVDNYRFAHGRSAYEWTASQTRRVVAVLSENVPRTPPMTERQRKAVESVSVKIPLTGSPPGKKVVGDDEYTVQFTRMEDGTREEYAKQGILWSRANTAVALANRSLALLLGQDSLSTRLGAQVNLYEHGIQSATRALRDGATSEWVVAALLHDIGELYSPPNHGSFVAAVLQPYVTKPVHWVLDVHEVFQGYYYFHHAGADRNRRELLLPHPYYNDAVAFCHHWDQNSFDPAYVSMPAEHFRPLLEEVFATPPFLYHPKHIKADSALAADFA